MTTTDLEPVTGEIERTAPLMPMGVDDARGAMAAYQELCSAVLAPADWIGNPGEPESFVRRSGWQKLATFYGVSTELVGDTRLERNGEGELMRASARARAIARDGRHADAGGACARNEKRFRSSAGRENIEHNLPSTAETRAQNRAVANLVGFGAVSAEEVDAAAAAAGPDLPPWAHDVPDEAIDRLGDYLVTILAAGDVAEPERRALEVGSALTNYCDGVFPAAAARLARLLAQAINPPTAPAEPEPEVVDGEPVETDEAAAAAPDVPPEGDSPA